MRFSDDAQDYFREWMQDLHTEARQGVFSAALEAHILKMPKTIASLALIFELVTGGRSDIGKMSLEKVFCWKEYLLSHVKRVYKKIKRIII